MNFRFYDWDDTLIKSRYALYRSYLDAYKHYCNGEEFTFSFFNKYIYSDSTRFFKSKNISDDVILKIKEMKNRLYETDYFGLIDTCFPKFESYEKYYIITNTNSELVKRFLERYNLSNKFEFVIGSDIINKRKPNPDLYLEAFKRIREEFENRWDTIHFYEDSIEGLGAIVRFLESMKRLGFEIENFKINHIT